MQQSRGGLRPLLLLVVSGIASAVAAPPATAAETVTPSVVYAEAMRIGHQLTLVERRLGVIDRHDEHDGHDENGAHEHEAEMAPLRMALRPRHALQKGYEIYFKLNRLREQLGIPVVSVGSLEPRLEVKPLLTYEQLRRIRAELDLLLERLEIDEPLPPVPVVAGKTPVDVYNKLRELSLHLDHVTGDQLVPSQVFGEAMRIYHDINAILSYLRISDETVPPAKREGVTPVDAYQFAFDLLGEVQRLQRMANIPRTDFSEFQGRGRAPSDVFEMTQLIIAELQTVKAHLGMRRDLTPTASHYSGKSPAEVQQVFGWCRRKLWLIDNNNFNR